MTHRTQFARPGRGPSLSMIAAASASALLAWGCNGNVGDAGVGSTGGGGTGMMTTGTSPLCEAGTTTVAAPRRLVRLTFNQIGNAVRSLLGAAAGDAITTKYEIGDPTQRAFPALTSPREGTSVTDAVWSKGDGIATTAGQYVFDNFAAVTGCATPTDACAQQFLSAFAEKAYRRPLVQSAAQNETDSLMQVYTEVKAAGSSIPEAVQFGVAAILNAPQFLYRFEFGDVASAGKLEVPLTPYEAASQLAFFLSDGPPDAALLDAAKQGKLATADGIAGQVNRLLVTDPVKQNLQDAMFTYFAITNLDNVVIDPIKVPEFTAGLKNAMYRESQDFLDTVLWKGKLNDLITSRSTVVNPDLAKIYGIPFPAGAPVTADSFVPADLPVTRAGLLTQAGFLSARARTDKDSVVARGLLVLSTMLCSTVPPPPDTLKDAIAAATTTLADKSERDKSAFRTMTSPCLNCHQNFDQYGLVLENFDVIGRYRTVDEANRPIDASGKLPADAGGVQVQNVADFAAQIASNGAFATCMTRNVMRYALADVTNSNVEKADCAVQAVSKKYLAGSDQSFGGLVREVALSKTLALRSGGK
jgi:hypothetical protein